MKNKMKIVKNCLPTNGDEQQWDDEGTDEEEQNQAHELTSDRCLSQNDEEEMLVDQIF